MDKFTEIKQKMASKIKFENKNGLKFKLLRTPYKEEKMLSMK